MSDVFSLNGAKRAAVRCLALVFLLVSAQWTVSLALPILAPGYMATSIEWSGEGVSLTPDPLELLPPDARARIAAAPGGALRFEQRIDQPSIRFWLFAIELVGRIPAIAAFACVGIALWRFARAPAIEALSGVPWLLRASASGIFMVLVAPISAGLRTGLLLDGVAPTALLDLHIDVDAFLQSLLIAAAAWVATWSIEAGLRARTELAEIV